MSSPAAVAAAIRLVICEAHGLLSPLKFQSCLSDIRKSGNPMTTAKALLRRLGVQPSPAYYPPLIKTRRPGQSKKTLHSAEEEAHLHIVRELAAALLQPFTLGKPHVHHCVTKQAEGGPHAAGNLCVLTAATHSAWHARADQNGTSLSAILDEALLMETVVILPGLCFAERSLVEAWDTADRSERAEREAA